MYIRMYIYTCTGMYIFVCTCLYVYVYTWVCIVHELRFGTQSTTFTSSLSLFVSVSRRSNPRTVRVLGQCRTIVSLWFILQFVSQTERWRSHDNSFPVMKTQGQHIWTQSLYVRYIPSPGLYFHVVFPETLDLGSRRSSVTPVRNNT